MIALGDVTVSSIVVSGPRRPGNRTAFVAGDLSDGLRDRLEAEGFAVHLVDTVANVEDGHCDRWFLVFYESGFDPPRCLVRADNASDAEEWMLETVTWAHLAEDEVKACKEDGCEVSWGPNGEAYIGDSIRVDEVRFLRAIA